MSEVAEGEARAAVGDVPRLVDLPLFRNRLGGLGVAEFAQDLGFAPQRFYFLCDVPSDVERGVHAHRRLRQCMLCLNGAVTVELEKAGRRWTFRLDRPDRALLVPPGCWRVLREFAGEAVVAVLASEPYDPTDYIYTYAEFRDWEAAQAASAPVVPYLDLARETAALEAEIAAATSRVVRAGRFIGGPEVEAFERAFAQYCGAGYGLGVGNGLDALTLVLQARGIGPGQSVLVPVNTFIATALAVSRTGAEPVFVDVEPDTANLDPAAAAAALRADTTAMIPVHLYGHPADIAPLKALARRHGLFLLEDAAQAHGARYRDRICGSLGDAAAFSFYPTKNLGALGDAGMVVSDDSDLLEKVRILANYGAAERDDHRVQGVNSRLDPIQAAVLAAKLPHLDGWNQRRRCLAARYREGLEDLAGLILPTARQWALPVWHVFWVRVADGRREALQRFLAESGIGTNRHYPRPIHLQPAYRRKAPGPGAFPVAERLAEESLSLPLGPFHSEAEIDAVIACIRKFFERANDRPATGGSPPRRS
jgi:dTDP-3-amino-3,4,6-trideoxy-alpha-D-glucose transaminase